MAKVWVNTIVNNEENFLYFAVMSIVDFVDKIIIWDTGSTDKTLEVIGELKKNLGEKIQFEEIGKVDKYQFSRMRQKMLDQSQSDWILILDGDEIWWRDSIKKVIQEIEKRGEEIEGIVVPMIVPVGDIYHIQEEKAGKYNIQGRVGHISLKAFSKKIPGLHVDWPYGKEGFFDKDNRLIQERKKIIFLDAPFLHLTHLKRSFSKRPYEKFKYELGAHVDEGFKFPEVLYEQLPKFLPSPWVRISGIKEMFAKTLTPLRKIKRRLV